MEKYKYIIAAIIALLLYIAFYYYSQHAWLSSDGVSPADLEHAKRN